MQQQLVVLRELVLVLIYFIQGDHLLLLSSYFDPLSESFKGVGLNLALFLSNAKQTIQEPQACSHC